MDSNKIANINVLEKLKGLKELKKIYLENNPITNYKKKVYEILENVKVIDGFDEENKSVESSIYDDEEGEELEEPEGFDEYESDEGDLELDDEESEEEDDEEEEEEENDKNKKYKR